MILPARTRTDAILKQFSPLQTCWLGKIFTYLINAKTDGLIAEALRSYGLIGEFQESVSEVGLRARAFIKSVEGNAGYVDHVALIAYVVERVNGLADFLFARLLIRFFSEHQQSQVQKFLHMHSLHCADLPTYQADRISWSAILAIGSRILSCNHDDIDWYAERYALTIRPTRRELCNAIVLVQHHNIRANARTVRVLQTNPNSTSKKVVAIQRAARETPFPEEFVRAATRTQAAASNWDHLFAWLIAFRFRKWQLKTTGELPNYQAGND